MFFTYIIGTVALILKPGPDSMFTLATAIGYGRKAAFAVMTGLILGLCIWITLLIIGMAAFFQMHPAVLQGIRVVGVVYILYLAVGALLDARRDLKGATADLPPAVLAAAKLAAEELENARRGDASAQERAVVAPPPVPPGPVGRTCPQTPHRLVLRGVGMSLSNPLTIMFFLAFLPAFVKEGTGLCPSAQIAVLGAVFCALVPVFYAPMILAAGWVGERFAANPKAKPRLKMVSAGVLVLVALALVVS